MHRTLLWIAALSLCLWPLACSGGSGGGSEIMGELSISATDAPFDRSLVTDARVRIHKVQIHRQATADSGFLTLYDGPGLELDLLNLRNGVKRLLVRADVPVGSYRQVRLFFDSARLELINGNVYSTDLGNLKLTSQSSSGLKVFVQPEIVVTSELGRSLLLDFDLSKTFRPIPANDALNANRYQLGPVIRAANLSESGELRGLVLADDGNGQQIGVDGASVYVLPPGETDPAASVASTGTEPDGSWAVIGLEPGLYDLLATEGGRSADATGVVITRGNVTFADLVLP